MVYKNLKMLIENGRYTKEDMQTKLDVFLMADRITADQYKELVALMEQFPPK